MIPTIKKLQADDSLRLDLNCNWIVTGKHGSDITKTFKEALAFWLWHCGVPARYCFKNKRNKKNVEMKLNFVKLANLWYAQIPDYTGDIDELEMIAGADDMCETLDIDGDGLVQTLVRDIPFPKEKLGRNFTLELVKVNEDEGADYKCPELDLEVWLCSVTKYVFGKFPKTIYIKTL